METSSQTRTVSRMEMHGRGNGLCIRVVMLALLLAVGAFLVACGSSSSSKSSSATPSSSSQAKVVDGVSITVDPSLKAMLPANILSAGRINVASDIPYPPWEYFVGTTKQPGGLDYDLSQAIGAKIGIPVSFLITPFAGIILSIKSGSRDMIMSEMFDTAAREKSGVTYVDYSADGNVCLTRKGNPKGITDLNSLAGHPVATQIGNTSVDVVQSLNSKFKSEGKPQMTLYVLPTQPACLLSVTSGRSDALVTNLSLAVYVAKTTNAGNTFEVIHDPKAPAGYYPNPVGIGMVSTNTGLINAVQKALQGLIEQGAYTKIMDKYGMPTVKSAQINQGAHPSPTPAP